MSRQEAGIPEGEAMHNDIDRAFDVEAARHREPTVHIDNGTTALCGDNTAAHHVTRDLDLVTCPKCQHIRTDATEREQ